MREGWWYGKRVVEKERGNVGSEIGVVLKRDGRWYRGIKEAW